FSSVDVDSVVTAGNTLHELLETIHREASRIQLGALAAVLGTAALGDMLEPIRLNPPNPHNLNIWLGVVDSWVDPATRALGSVAAAALDELLRGEAEVAARARNPASPGNGQPAEVDPAS